MVRGLYTAAMGMNVQAKRLEVVSNDLANADTSGYKKDIAIVSDFKEQYLTRLRDKQNFNPNNGRIGQITYGAKIQEIYTNFDQGPMVSTSLETDMALDGEGFFSVQTPTGVAYTRDGNFSVNQFGQLVTKEGYSVLGEEGPIELGEDYFTLGVTLSVRQGGEVYVDEDYIDTLAVVNFEDLTQMDKLDDNYYTTDNEAIPFTGTVIQTYLEAPNVSVVDSMVNMITVARMYEMNQKMVQTQDELLGRAVNDLGKEQ